MRITGHIKKSRRVRMLKVPKMRPAPKMTPDEKAGADMLTRVWDSLQRHGQRRDKLTPKTQKKYIDGNVLFESMFLVSKIRGRIRAGYYR